MNYYHPAEFARKGSELLQSFQNELSREGSDPKALEALFSNYDKRVSELLNKRKEISQKEYRAQAVSCFQRGCIPSFLAVWLGSILYEVVYGARTPLRETSLLAVIVGLVGGIFIMHSRAPRDLKYTETKNSLLMHLYQDPSFLTEHYQHIKGPYERKKEKQKPLPSKEEKKNEEVSLKRRVKVRKELKQGVAESTTTADEKAPVQKKTVKRFFTKLWKPAQEENCEKKGISVRFLKGVAKRRAAEKTKISVLVIGDSAAMTLRY